MSGETRIIAFGANGSEARGNAELRENQVEATSQDSPETYVPWDVGEEEIPDGVPRNYALPSLAGLAIVGWTAFYLWSQWSIIAAAAPTQIPAMASQWAVPVLLVVAVWLLIMRHSTREAARFGDAASVLSRESANLESRMSVVNRELSLAREFIAAQSRDLEALGRVAVDRLSQHADRLQSLIAENGAQVEAIQTVSQSALENMDRLRGQLPVIATSAKDVTNHIGNAGRIAQAQLDDLAGGFTRLSETSLACDNQVVAVRQAMETASTEFSQVSEELERVTATRFDALAERSVELRTQIENEEAHALTAIRTRANTLAYEIEGVRVALDRDEAESLTSLRARLTSLRDESGVVGRSLQENEARAADSWAARLSTVEEQRAALEAHVAEAERISLNTLRERAETLAQISEELRVRIAEGEHEALKAFEHRSDRIRTRAGELHAQITATEQEALARLNANLTVMDGAIAERLTDHQRHSDALVWRSQAISGSLSEHGQRMAEVAQNSAEIEATLTRSLVALTDQLAASRTTLASTDREVEQLTDNSVRLLELIKASAHHSSGVLAEALSTADDRLSGLGEKLLSLVDNIEAGSRRTVDLNGAVEVVQENLVSLQNHIETGQISISERNETHYAELATLRASVEELERVGDRVHTRTKMEMNSAIERLAVTVRGVLSLLQEEGTAKVRALADQLGEDSASAIDRVMRPRAAEAAGALEQAVAHASGAGREAAAQMREQIVAVEEAVGHLESRIEEARNRAQEQVDNDFSRRAALISDALKSNAIDVASALSSEVADTAWSAYLRGDRGIFTRRAVSLLGTSEARAVQQLFERDDSFREHVNRYIHDFEALLRQILSTRDGNALGVTLLSSDIGKLYVALAQGIERLRN